MAQARENRTASCPVELLEHRRLLAATLVKDIDPSTADRLPYEIAELDGRVYFLAFDVDLGRELWTSDGTPAGTTLLKDVIPGVSGFTLRDLTRAGNLLFFIDGNTDQIYRSDGTAQGTYAVTPPLLEIGRASCRERV